MDKKSSKYRQNVGCRPVPVSVISDCTTPLRRDAVPHITDWRALPDHDPIKLNRDHGRAFCLSMIFFRKPVSTFRDHALTLLRQKNAALIVVPSPPPVAGRGLLNS